MEQQTLKSKSISLGIILGLVLAIFTISCYIISLELFANIWLLVLSISIILGFGIVGSANAKKLNNGFATFKEAFTGYFITIVIGLAINTLTSTILFNIVDEKAGIQITQTAMENQVEMMERYNAPEESIDQIYEKMEGTNQFAYAHQFQGYLWFVVFMSVLGLVVALVMKHKDPSLE